MTTIYRDPTGNGTGIWNAYAYTLIDDGIRNGVSSGFDSTQAQADDGDDGQEQQWTCSNLPSDVVNIVSVTLYAYCWAGTANIDVTAKHAFNGNWSSASGTVTVTTTHAWRSFTWGSPQAGTASQSVGMSLTPGSINSGNSFDVESAYLEIVYSTANAVRAMHHRRHCLGVS